MCQAPFTAPDNNRQAARQTERYMHRYTDTGCFMFYAQSTNRQGSSYQGETAWTVFLPQVHILVHYTYYNRQAARQWRDTYIDT